MNPTRQYVEIKPVNYVSAISIFPLLYFRNICCCALILGAVSLSKHCTAALETCDELHLPYGSQIIGFKFSPQVEQFHSLQSLFTFRAN